MKARAIGRRLATLVASLLVASLIVFGLLNLLPGDVAQVILGKDADPASLAALRAQLGLDKPFLVRYARWLAAIFQGDLGRSALTGDTVASSIGPAFGVTLWLITLGMTLAVAVALPVGMCAALARRRWTGVTASALSQIGMSIPAFLAGILLVLGFSVKLRWLPANGYVNLTDDPADWLRHLVLPVISLALVQASVLTRYVRSAFIDVLNEDWFRTARAIGWTQRAAMWRHGLRNAGLSVITVLGLQLATLFVGAIVVESVFVLPGLGSLLLTAVGQHDLTLVQGIVMLLVVLVLAINAIVDLAYLLLDPRLRSGSQISAGDVAEPSGVAA